MGRFNLLSWQSNLLGGQMATQLTCYLPPRNLLLWCSLFWFYSHSIYNSGQAFCWRQHFVQRDKELKRLKKSYRNAVIQCQEMCCVGIYLSQVEHRTQKKPCLTSMQALREELEEKHKVSPLFFEKSLGLTTCKTTNPTVMHVPQKPVWTSVHTYVAVPAISMIWEMQSLHGLHNPIL